jgi:hypothetical protein
MRKIRILHVNASNTLRCVATLLALAFPVGNARTASSTVGALGARDVSQAVITYGFLRWDYLEFDRLVSSSANLPVLQDLKSLDEAISSINCDVPMRMAGHHEALILPADLVGQWIGFERPGGRNSTETGWLFLIPSGRTAAQRVLVVFSSGAPEHSTIFWLDQTAGRYSVSLLYDSFKKGKVSNAATTVGAVTSVKLKEDNLILLSDWGEPGIGPPRSTGVRRVFRLNLLDGTIALDETAAPRTK